MRHFSPTPLPLIIAALAAAMVGAVSGCASPTARATADDASVTFEDPRPVTPESLRDRALAACRAQGKQQAMFESQMNADAKLPAGQGPQLSTFICR